MSDLAGQASDGVLDAIMRNTVSPTAVRAGHKTDVIPGVAMFHGPDERVPVDGYRWGVRVYLDAVGRLAYGEPGPRR
jgi:acetylornithine deacetylase/succinyl-diaminopimelate desuccinylase-like protein